MQGLTGPVFTGKGKRDEFCNAEGGVPTDLSVGLSRTRRVRLGTRGRKSLRYSGETDVRPHSSHRRYTIGSDSHRPITCALGTPQRGHTTPPAGRRLAMGLTSYVLDGGQPAKDSGRAWQSVVLSRAGGAR